MNQKMLIFRFIETNLLIVMSTVSESKPKRELNPIIKSMNDFRNNVIGEHIGSKAPVKTAPIFKLALSAARVEMGLEESDKNTIEVVNKATQLFQAEPDKYVSVAASQPAPEKKSIKSSKKEASTDKKSKSKKSAGTKEKKSKQVKAEKEDSSEDEESD